MLSQNFSTVNQQHAELCRLKAENLDACIRPLLQIQSQLYVCLIVLSPLEVVIKISAHPTSHNFS